MNDLLNTTLAWAAQAEETSPSLFPPEMVMMFLIIFGLFYILILRPQRREQRQREEMLNELNKGDKIVTAGGIHGSVEGVDKANGTVTVSVAPKVHITINRTSVASVTDRKNKPKNEKNEKNEKTAASK